MMPSRGYLLCCIERTGSNLLAQALAGTAFAGRPREYFNPVEPKMTWMQDLLGDSALASALPKILSAGTTPNGWFGAKVHWSHFQYLGMCIRGEEDSWRRAVLRERLRPSLPELSSKAATPESLTRERSSRQAMATAYASLRSLIPDLRLIWMKRQNMVARAISHYRARQTGLWHQPISHEGVVPGNAACNFDFAGIRILCGHGAFQEASWQRFFQEHEISPHCVVYEEFVADYEPTVRRVLKFLDLDGEQTVIPPPYSLRQSDALSEEWEERYRKLSAEGRV